MFQVLKIYFSLYYIDSDIRWRSHFPKAANHRPFVFEMIPVQWAFSNSQRQRVMHDRRWPRSKNNKFHYWTWVLVKDQHFFQCTKRRSYGGIPIIVSSKSTRNVFAKCSNRRYLSAVTMTFLYMVRLTMIDNKTISGTLRSSWDPRHKTRKNKVFSDVRFEKLSLENVHEHKHLDGMGNWQSRISMFPIPVLGLLFTFHVLLLASLKWAEHDARCTVDKDSCTLLCTQIRRWTLDSIVFANVARKWKVKARIPTTGSWQAGRNLVPYTRILYLVGTDEWRRKVTSHNRQQGKRKKENVKR